MELPDTIRNRIRNRAALIRANLERHADVRVTPPRLGISADTTLRLGATEVRLLAFGPAHTDGDIAVLVPAERLLVTGDLAQPMTVLGLDPEVGDVQVWIAALDRLTDLAAAHRVRFVVGGNRSVGDRSH